MKRIYSSLLVLFFSFTGTAQIVNIESKRMQSDTTGWMGSLGAAFSLIKNVQQIVSADANAHLQYKTQKDLYLFLAHYNLLKRKKENLSNNVFYHLRYNHKINSWLRWEVFTQLQKNAVTGIKLRALAGTGPRFKIVDSKQFHFYAATAAMYEYEEETTSPSIIHRNVRSSSYLSFTYSPNAVLEIISTTFYQPLFKNISDFRLLNELRLSVKATKHFSITTTWNYLYDAYPAGNTPNINYTITNGLTYAF